MKIKYFIIILLISFEGISKPLIFRNLGPNINNQGDEFLPIVYKDTLYFKRTIKDKPNQEYSIYRIACKDITLNPLGKKPEIINFYNTKEFQNSKSPIDPYASTKGYISFDPSTPSFYNFSYDKLANGHILDKPEKLEFPVSTDYNDMHPALSPDGKFIIFASDRPKKRGSTEREKDTDLYITYRQSNGSWSKPKNLGKEINTSENEIAPFIANDGTLYYSSKGFIFDSVNLVFSGDKNNNTKLSDIYIIKEKKNYNIIKAEFAGNANTPFVKPKLLPRPYNTEFNEIAATIMKDTLLIIASDRLAPFYDRPDPTNQVGYDLYGFLEDEDIDEDSLNKTPFFVTGYYEPLNTISLKSLKEKIRKGVFRTNSRNSYIANPDDEIDELGKKIDYNKHSVTIENYFKSLARQIERKLQNTNKIYVNIVGYADSRKIREGSIYVENDIIDKEFNFEFKKNTKIDNLSLSKIRAYMTFKYLKELVEKFPSLSDKKNNIIWSFSGQGVLDTQELNLLKRKVKVEISNNEISTLKIK